MNQVVREMLQSVADIPLGDWFEYAVGPPVIDLTAAPHGGARYPVEARMPVSVARPALQAARNRKWLPSTWGLAGWARPAAEWLQSGKRL